LNGLLTDLYELTMAAGYFAAGRHTDIGTFEFTIRRLPRNRDFVLLAGIHRAVDYLLNLSFQPDEITYLRGLESFRRAPQGFWDYLASFRFTGDVFAVPEGTVLHAGQPVLNVRAPLIEGQIPETYLLAAITFETLIASKAARIAHAAQGRDVVEFGTRRAHSPEAGVLGARAAYIGGCTGTSNALAGFRYGIPVVGTAAHSWVMSFETETEAFRELQTLLADQTVQLIDTYDPLEGARIAARLGKPLRGVRIDSGDLLRLSRQIRRILDSAGLRDVKIKRGSRISSRTVHPWMPLASARNWQPQATRPPWERSTSWSRSSTAARPAIQPRAAPTSARCPVRSNSSAIRNMICWRCTPNAPQAPKRC
jgi:nicotinate phosphoribosyltransferase